MKRKAPSRKTVAKPARSRPVTAKASPLRRTAGKTPRTARLVAKLVAKPAAPVRVSRPPIKSLRRVKISADYRPTEKEPFMNQRMREYFRQRLVRWRRELVDESSEALGYLQEGTTPEADLADRASTEVDRTLKLRTRERARKLIDKIDEALERVANGSYGYCEDTNEPITLRRLEARPIATLSIEAQERHERMERTHRSD